MGEMPLNLLPEKFYQQFLSELAINRVDDASECIQSFLYSCKLNVIFYHNVLVVRALMPLETRPGLISLLVGKPNSAAFPIKSLSFTSQDPNDPSKEISIELTPEELDLGLQYSPTTGIPQLINWLYELQEVSHNRKQGEGWKLSVGNDSHDLIYKVRL